MRRMVAVSERALTIARSVIIGMVLKSHNIIILAGMAVI